MKEFNFSVSLEDSGMRLDAFVAKQLSPAVSRSTVKKLIDNNNVSLNSKTVKPSHKVSLNDAVFARIPEDESVGLEPNPIPLNIIYEDEDIIIIDKPSGLSVHPGAGNKKNTLANALVAYTSKLSLIDPERPGIVHRLDKETSGLLVIARNAQAHLNLIKQFKDRSVHKVYIALVEGDVQFDEGLIDAPIAPDPRRRELMKVDFSCSRIAKTIYKVIERYGNFTLLELSPLTGRTHQLRVHMKYLGHSILGDKKYASRIKFCRLALHSKFLSFSHPVMLEKVEFNSPIPREFKEFIDKIKKGKDN